MPKKICLEDTCEAKRLKAKTLFGLQIDGKSIDIALARKQHADLVKSLRDKTGLDVLELPPDESNALSVFTQVDHPTIPSLTLIGHTTVSVALALSNSKLDLHIKTCQLRMLLNYLINSRTILLRVLLRDRGRSGDKLYLFSVSFS